MLIAVSVFAVDVVVMIRICSCTTSYLDVVSIASRSRSIVVLRRHLVLSVASLFSGQATRSQAL